MIIGDHGSGGTTHSYTYTETKGSKQFNKCCCIVVLGILTVITLGFWIYFEIDYQQKMTTLKAIKKNIPKGIPSGDEGVEYIQDNKYDGKLVHIQDVSIKAQDLKDEEFEFTFNKLAMRRKVQYCQWEETRHERQYDIGKDANNNTIYRVEIYYTYYKDWRDHRINSFYFDNSISYNNPQRDPVQEQYLYSEVQMGKTRPLKFEVIDMDLPSSMKYKRHILKKSVEIGDYAYKNGFTKTSQDRKWAYSEYKDSYDTLRKVAGLVFDGVYDLGFKGKCTPGDIRVGWDLLSVPKSLSVIGVYENGNIEPYEPNGSKLLLVEPGKVSAERMVENYGDKYSRIIWISRIILGIILLILGGIFACTVLVNVDDTKIKEI